MIALGRLFRKLRQHEECSPRINEEKLVLSLNILRQVRKLVLDATDTRDGMNALRQLADQDRELARLPVWREIPQIDFAADIVQISQWLGTALSAFSESSKARVIIISLGDVPEVYQAIGWGCRGGEKRMPLLLDALKKGAEFENRVDWNEMSPLVDEYTSSLPGQLWKDFPWFESCTNLTTDAGELLWSAFAPLSTIECLKRRPDFTDILAGRPLAPVLIGFNEGQEYYGSITPKGWQSAEPRA